MWEREQGIEGERERERVRDLEGQKDNGREGTNES